MTQPSTGRLYGLKHLAPLGEIRRISDAVRVIAGRESPLPSLPRVVVYEFAFAELDGWMADDDEAIPRAQLAIDKALVGCRHRKCVENA